MPYPVDLQKLERVAPIEHDVKQLTTLFFKDTEEKMGKLETALQRQIWKDIQALAHSALGASRMLGFTPLGKLFERLEYLNGSDSIEEANRLFRAAQQEIVRAKEFVQSRITKKKRK